MNLAEEMNKLSFVKRTNEERTSICLDYFYETLLLDIKMSSNSELRVFRIFSDNAKLFGFDVDEIRENTITRLKKDGFSVYEESSKSWFSNSKCWTISWR